MKYFLLIIAGFLPFITNAQKPDVFIKSGNEYYSKGFMAAAEKDYDKALNTGYHAIALMNKGNALYKQGKYNEAIKAYQEVSANTTNDKMLRSGAYYNTGVVYSSQQKTAESIEEYKNALRLNWQDQKARENLQKALLEKKSGGGGAQSQQQQQSQANMSKSQAQQQLQKLEEKEKSTQQKISKEKSQYSGSAGKDW